MGLSNISLRNFRCFTSAEVEFAPNLNLIYGENAAGKTSLIESIFLLGRGRSFKTANLGSAVYSGANGFQINGQVNYLSTPMRIGLVRDGSQLQATIGGNALATLAQLSEILPIQLIDSQVHQLIRGGPRCRRQFLDWGVFHVEPIFFPAWRRYQRALRQRNSLLRNGKSKREVESWDGELVSQGETLDRLRRQYMANLLPTAKSWASQALGGLDINLEYRPGWPESQRLLESLQYAFDRDLNSGTTLFGPHRAEMLIKVDGKVAQEWISSGQEKVLAGSLLLAQAAVYRSLTGRPCTLLLDDLAAELDPYHLTRFLERIDETHAQTHVTSIEASPLIRERATKLFHVKQGKIDSMI
ncbi:MAG TPA: DNA replication/repair protein RecF [Gammaproteobacteria bacterium]|nr:DNA replication/repair protein RecF [Gammaproteobacteria bacterium]